SSSAITPPSKPPDSIPSKRCAMSSSGPKSGQISVAVHDELMESLAELRRALPSMRLGQLIANMATVARGAVPGAIWEAEDDELLAAIRWQLQQLSSTSAVNGAKQQPASAPKTKRHKRRRPNS